MKPYKIMTLALIGVFLLIAVTMLIYNFYIVQDVIYYKMQYEVGNDMGINVDTDAIYFGRATQGSTSRRKVSIENNNPYPVLVSIKTTGNISFMVSVSENNFIVEPNTVKEITYYAKSKDDTPLGEYFGETRILLKRVI